jgi:hypothetical protein
VGSKKRKEEDEPVQSQKKQKLSLKYEGDEHVEISSWFKEVAGNLFKSTDSLVHCVSQGNDSNDWCLLDEIFKWTRELQQRLRSYLEEKDN